jgi:glutathione S-transferase
MIALWRGAGKRAIAARSQEGGMADGRLLLGTRRYSSWSLRGWLAVRLAGLDVEEVLIRLEGGGPGSEVARQSPSGLVPFLEHQGVQVWESLAICEYCAEAYPALWPQEKAARARARSISAEMHAGFSGLRKAMPMVLGRDGAGRGQTAEAMADIARIETLWRETRAQFGGDGPYLFGALFNGADVMYAPVVTRLLTYQPAVGADTRAYCEAVRAHPLVDEWYGLAALEPAEWRMEHYETSP